MPPRSFLVAVTATLGLLATVGFLYNANGRRTEAGVEEGERVDDSTTETTDQTEIQVHDEPKIVHASAEPPVTEDTKTGAVEDAVDEVGPLAPPAISRKKSKVQEMIEHWEPEGKENAAPPSPVIIKKRYDPTKAKAEREARMKKIHFAAGCFWSVELAFQRTVGVYSTSVGYTQGHVNDPTYADVKTGNSGHAEAVEVVYDPEITNLENLLDVFWGKHDPTTKNKAGNDKGTQYRSGIYYFTEDQKDIANMSKAAQKAALKKPWKKIFTEIKPASTFWLAEEYHQKYLSEKGGRNGVAQDPSKGCTDPIRCYG